MRLAVLADIHGNLASLEAALEHAQSQRVDQLIVAGDVVNCGPDSAACWSLVRSLGCPIVRGNHERYLADFDTPGFMPELHTERFMPVQWTVQQFSAVERKAMDALPLSLLPDGVSNLRITHASLRNEFDGVSPFTPDKELREMFAGTAERYVVRAHNHVCFDRSFDGKHIFSIGSVGLPLTGFTTAQYAILEGGPDGWRISHQSVSYDVETTLERFRETGCLEGSGPMGRLLMREVATATPQLVPFLRQYERWSCGGELSLDLAVTRFLNAY